MKATIISTNGIATGVKIITEDGIDICKILPVRNIYIDMTLNQAIMAKLDLDIIAANVDIPEAIIELSNASEKVLIKMGWVKKS